MRGMPSRRRFEWAEGLPRVVGTSGAKRTVLDYMAPRWRLPRSSYQITAAASLPAGAGSGCSGFGRNVLVGHVGHLDAAVLGGERILRVLQLLLAEAHGNKLLRVDVEILDQKAGNRLSPLIRQGEVIGIEPSASV